MKGKGILIAIIVAIIVLAGGTGLAVYKALFSAPSTSKTPLEEEVEQLPPVDPSVKVNVKKAAKENTILLSIAGLAGKITSLEYEITYESERIVQGVNSGSKPLETGGKDMLEREVYLGTCSKNVCRPHPGVKKVTVVVQFNEIDGKRSQFSKDYDL